MIAGDELLNSRQLNRAGIDADRAKMTWVSSKSRDIRLFHVMRPHNVEVKGLDPSAYGLQSRRSTRLSYTPDLRTLPEQATADSKAAHRGPC